MLAGEPVGVAVAVEALVMVSGNLGGHVQEAAGTILSGDFFQRVGPDRTMLLHHLALFVGQRARFLQDRIGNPYFADIVQRAGSVKVFNESFVDFVSVRAFPGELLG